MFRVKICGITNVDDALMAAAADADIIGLNFYGKSPRCVSVSQAAKIASEVWIQLYVGAVGVFVNHTLDEIAAVLDLDGVFGVQLHGDELPEFAASVSKVVSREQGFVIPVKRLTANGIKELPYSLTSYRDAGARIDAVLIDSCIAGAYGGTGETVSWIGLADHRRWLGETPLILAGGLTPDNVAEAIRIVRPAAVDVASGVESSPGKKDPAKVRDFVANALGAFAALK